MKKHVSDLRKKSIKELEKEVESLKADIGKSFLEISVQPVKDTNVIAKKRRQLAALMTVLNENRIVEKNKPEKVSKVKSK